ncbi:recombinase family protein [Chloroflexota bacterium]
MKMVIQTIVPTSNEILDEYVAQAAKAAGYEKGFGIGDCDLSKPIWWAAYCRQSLDQQTQNNRLPEYLLTLAKMARDYGVVVPREYVLYDHETGEHLERPRMIQLRKLMAERRIAGIIFPALDRLSREPLHQQIFEMEAAHYDVQLYYADAPSGNDPGSQFARTILAHAAKLVKLANRKNNRGGNIGRVVSGNVPAGKTSYGYKYEARYEDLGHGRRKLVKADWVIDRKTPERELEWGSEAWTVTQIFHWVGHEERSLYWVAKKLNEMGIKPRYAGLWSPSLVSFVVKNRCYMGHHVYNKAAYVPNPKKPLGDITGAVKRTIRQEKPEGERVAFEVPVLVTRELWELANNNLVKRGRGRGKDGKSIDALLRRRVFCPQCNQMFTLYKDSKYDHLTYYKCSTRFQAWKKERCHVPSFRVNWLDNLAWDCVYSLMKQPSLVEEYLSSSNDSKRVNELRKRIRSFKQKIEQSEAVCSQRK